jgi:effector-binding domain-containing protein
MKRLLLVVGIIVAVLIIGEGFFIFSMRKHIPKFEDVKYLLEPRIVTKDSIKVLVVESVGDPKKMGKPALSLLFKTYFKIKDRPKGRAIGAIRARWPKPPTTPKNEWLGIYALPVLPTATQVPSVKSKAGLRVELREWQYGAVAEILHVGPYIREKATVDKLKQFITQSGYEICGAHEEEYLKGPGFFSRNPENYLTIIRYQVRKVAK